MHETGFIGLRNLSYFCLSLSPKSAYGFSYLQLLFIADGCPKKPPESSACLLTLPDAKEKIFKFKLRVPWIPPCAIQSPCTKISPDWIMWGQGNSLPNLNLCDIISCKA